MAKIKLHPGDGCRFDGCDVDEGIVLQERASEAVLLAVVVDMAAVGRATVTTINGDVTIQVWYA